MFQPQQQNNTILTGFDAIAINLIESIVTVKRVRCSWENDNIAMVVLEWCSHKHTHNPETRIKFENFIRIIKATYF